MENSYSVENIKRLCVFKLADLMRSIKTNGASKNPDWHNQNGWFMNYVFLLVSFVSMVCIPILWIFWPIFWRILVFWILFFWKIFLTYNLLTIASFRIEVPSILFFWYFSWNSSIKLFFRKGGNFYCTKEQVQGGDMRTSLYVLFA